MRMRSLLLLACLLLLCGRPHDVEARDGEPLTVQRVFGGKSFLQGLPGWSWRPGHTELVRLTSVGERDQRRSVLLARTPEEATPRTLVDLTALESLVPGRGVRTSGIGRGGAPRYRWRPDGKALCAVVKGDLVWVDLLSGSPRRLTETSAPIVDPRVSPDGRHVAFTRAHDLHVVPTDGSRPPRALTTGGSEELRNASLDWVYPEELSFDRAVWWAPDGQHLCYLQLDERKVPKHRLPDLMGRRGEGREMYYPRAGDPNPSARLGVVPVGGGPTVWLDLGSDKVEYVVRVAWTPDSSRVLVVTMDRKQQLLEVVSCRLGDGKSVLLQRERDAAWIDAPPAPKFVSDHQYLWRTHVGDHESAAIRWWLVETAPEHAGVVSVIPLTPDTIDAGAVLHFDAGERTFFFEGTEHGGTDRRVYRGAAPAEAGKQPWAAPAPFLVGTGGWHSAKVDHTGSWAVVRHSAATRPAREELRKTGDGALVAELGDARTSALTALTLSVPEMLRVPTTGGHLNVRLWQPADLAAQRAADPDRTWPLLVHVYAGPGSRMVRDSWGRGPIFHTLLNQRGFLVAEIDGRGSGAQGARFTRAVYGRLGMLELEDQVLGVQTLAKRDYVDGGRVGIWGWSYGGTMACNALVRRSDVFRAGVAVASVTDWRLYDSIYTERYMGLPGENKAGYEETAATRHAKTMDGHLLLMHGLGDDNVHAQNTVQMTEALIKAKKTNFDVMLYPRRGHGIGGASVDVFTRLVEHFERHLK
jgi:dipeptidyl-peptidase-4